MTSTDSWNDFRPLELDSAALEQHFSVISSVLRDVTGKRRIQFTADIDTVPVSPSLVGQDCRFAFTTRRGRTPVAPLVQFKEDFSAWIAASGQWESVDQRSKRRMRMFRFVSFALSVYFGPRDDENKLLMFRAEWFGSRPGGGGGYTFVPPTAAHPHWHFDALSSLVASARRAVDVPAGPVPTVESLIGARTSPIADFLGPSIDRIHFASGAAWWSSESAHLHTPADRAELESWARACAMYMKSELRSLVRPGFRHR